MRVEDLRKLIQAEMKRQGLSFRAAAGRSQGLISHGHLNALAQGKPISRIDDRVLTGIALALDVPVSKVRKAYGTDPVGPVEFVLPPKSAGLTRKQRDAILAMVDAFLDGNKPSPGRG